MSASDLSESDPFGAAPFSLTGSRKQSEGSQPCRPNQLSLSATGLSEHNITSYAPLYSEENDIELQVRHRHSSEASSASHEGSQSVTSSRSGKDLFTSSFTRMPAEDRSKYEKLTNDDFDSKKQRSSASSSLSPNLLGPSSSSHSVNCRSTEADNDSIGSASDLRERVDSSGDEEGSSPVSEDEQQHPIPSDIRLYSEPSNIDVVKNLPVVKNVVGDVLIGHTDGERPLLEDDDSPERGPKVLSSKKSSSSTRLVSSPTGSSKVTQSLSPTNKEEHFDVFGAAPFRKSADYSNLAKAPLLPSEQDQKDVFAQAPFKIPLELRNRSLKKKKEKSSHPSSGPTMTRSSRSFGSAQAITLNDISSGIAISSRKASMPSVKYIASTDYRSPPNSSENLSTDLFGSQPFSQVPSKDNSSVSTSQMTKSPPTPTVRSNLISSQLASGSLPLPKPVQSMTNSAQRKSGQDLFGAVPFSSVAPVLSAPKKLPPPIAPKPKSLVNRVSSVISTGATGSSYTESLASTSGPSKTMTDNGNFSRDSSGSFSSESCEEAKLTTSSQDKLKYAELLDDDISHDENVNVVPSRHYTQLKPMRKKHHSRKRESKDKTVSTNAFSNMSFEDNVSDEESPITRSFVHDSRGNASIKRTSNSFRIV